jgi:hypothetical protein
VLGKTSIQIVGPADVGSISVFAGTTENVNEAFHSAHSFFLRGPKEREIDPFGQGLGR